MTQEERIEEYLQKEYKDYVRRYKDNYYDVNYMNYEAWCDYEELHDMFVCNQCLEVLPSEEKGTSELALQDGICKECMQNGYGK
jgi:hypothetical protein